MQTILTQCPRCQTSFKVSDKQLAIAAGMVRCGSCLDVFSAPANRITIKQPVAAPAPLETVPDEHEEQSNAEQQAAPVAPSAPHDSDPYHQEASQLIESAALESGYGVATPDSASPVDISATRPDENAPADFSGDLEFILDYEDDVPLGDLVLDDLSQDDGVDAEVPDAGNAAEDNTYAEPECPGEESFHGDSFHKGSFHEDSFHEGSFHEEPEQEKHEDTGFIHETGPQPVEPEPRGATIDLATDQAETFVAAADDPGDSEAVFPEVDGMSLQETVSELTETAESIQGSEDSPQTSEEPEEIIAFAAQEFWPEQDEHTSAVVTDFQPSDSERSNYPPDTEQPAAEQDPGSLVLDDLADSFEANIETADVDDDPDDLDPADSFTATGVADTDDFHTPGFSALSSAEIEEIELGAAKPQPQRDKTELREYLAELEDADALEPLPSATMESIEEEPLTFEVRHVFRKYVTTFGWFVLSVALLATLILQVVANNLEFMQRSPSYSRYLPVFCKVLDCPEPEGTAAISGLRSQDLLVRSHPDVADALEVSFIFSNDADMPQAFPLIELSFMDSNRRLMANRLFRPAEYLPPELDALGEMPASSSVQVTMEMSDPGSDAVNYAIMFRDPLTGNPAGSPTPATTR